MTPWGIALVQCNLRQMHHLSWVVAVMLGLSMFGDMSATACGAQDSKHHNGAKGDNGAQQDKRTHDHDVTAGAAKWYVTMHGENSGNTIRALDPKGALVPGSMLGPVTSGVAEPKDLRGMLHLGDSSLLVVSAFKNDTRLVRYGPAGDAGVRPFMAVFTEYSETANPGLVHTYALAVGTDGTIFASDQDTNTVTRFGGIGSETPGSPLASPAEIAGLGLPPGVLIPSRQVSPGGLVKVRGLAIAPDGSLLVADKGASRVVSYDPQTGALRKVLADRSHGLKGPIQVLVTPDSQRILIGDNEAHCVFAVSLADGSVTTLLDSKRCPEEPSALLIDGHSLLLGDRKTKSIRRFDLDNPSKAPTILANGIPDAPEFLLLASPGG